MADLVVTVPRDRWAAWLGEGGRAGEPDDALYAFALGRGPRPPIEPGERVYIVAWDRLRGYAPLVEVANEGGVWRLIRRGATAVAVTLDAPVRGFPGWKERWWRIETEIAFPAWATEGVPGAPPAPAPPIAEADERDELPEVDDVAALRAIERGPEQDEDGAVKPRVLTPGERKALAQGKVLCNGGKVYTMNRAPFHHWTEGACQVCADARAQNTTPRRHKHRVTVQERSHGGAIVTVPLACRYCRKERVFPRGQSESEVVCLACGRWWDTFNPDDIDCLAEFERWSAAMKLGELVLERAKAAAP